MVHENSVVERERLIRRLELCKKELARAKFGIQFWSKELGLVVDAIQGSSQFNFEGFWNEDGEL